MRFILVFTALASALAFAQTKPATSETRVCSYYSRQHDGHITAGGKKFNSNALTAAHRTYPMGTKLKLTNTANDKSVEVVVNDRGPFVGDRIIDLSRRSAQFLGVDRKGTAKVRVRRVYPSDREIAARIGWAGSAIAMVLK